MARRDTRNRIRLGTLGGLFHIQVNHTGCPHEWQVTSIDLYADANYILLIADDVQIDALPQESQDAIISALNDYEAHSRHKAIAHQFARNLQRELRDIMGNRA